MYMGPEINGDFRIDTWAWLGLSNPTTISDSYLDVFDMAQTGLPINYVNVFINKSGLTEAEMSQALQTSQRTLRRWARLLSVLPPQQSCQLWLVATVFAKAVHTLGSADIALNWLRHRQTSLNQRSPITLLVNSVGCFALIRLLDQIDHCVYI